MVTCKENKILNFSWSKYKAPVKMIFSKWKAIKQKEIKKTKQNKTNKQKKEISINNANYALQEKMPWSPAVTKSLANKLIAWSL